MTIRERILKYQNEILAGNLQPDRAAEILTEISALLGNINDKITETDMLYNKKLLSCLESEKSANKAKIVAGTTEEYKNMRDTHNTKELTIELIRSLKYYLKCKTDEFNSGKFQ